MHLEQVYVSAVAFGAVFLMLSILAALMGVLTRLFPGKHQAKKKSVRAPSGGPDQELLAAVTAAVSTAVAGGHVTRIEEIQ